MDVLQYRDTGEFSDITIHVGTEAFKLHKFPLLIKSTYIKDKANANSVTELKLEEFPGGASNFAQVADFCYGKRIDITLRNMVGLYCAAEYLQMVGEGNLLAVAKRYVSEVLNSAKLSRSLVPVVDLLAHGCAMLLPDVSTVKPHALLYEVFETLLEIWPRASAAPSAYGSWGGLSSSGSGSGVDQGVVDRLLQIDLRLFAELIRGPAAEESPPAADEKPTAVKNKEDPEGNLNGADEESKPKDDKDNPSKEGENLERTPEDAKVPPKKSSTHKVADSHRLRIVADVIFRYLSRVFQLQDMENYRKSNSTSSKRPKAERDNQDVDGAEVSDKKDTTKAEGEGEEAPKEETTPAGDESAESPTKNTKKRDDQYFADDSGEEGEGQGGEKKKSRKSSSKRDDARHFGTGSHLLDEALQLKHSVAEYLDTLLEALDPEAPLKDVVNPTWLEHALQLAVKEELRCRPRLLQLCGTQLDRFSNDELRHLPSTTLCESITAAVREGKPIAVDVLTCVLDSHLKEMAKKGELSVEDFITIVKNIPESSCTSLEYNSMYEVLEELLTSGLEVPDAQKQELFDLIDFSRCSEDNLQRALDKEIVPLKTLCQAAIKRARRNREEGSVGYPRSDHKFTSEEPAMRLRSTPHLSSTKRPLPTHHHHVAPSVSSAAYAPVTASGYNYPHSIGGSLEAGPVGIGGDYYGGPASASLYDQYSTSPSLRYAGTGGYGRGFDDSSIMAFEENLRGELNRISQNYDSYFKDRQRKKVSGNPATSNLYNPTSISKGPRNASGAGYPSSAYGW